MILPDVNVLIYAFRKEVLQHADSKDLLEAAINGDSSFGVSKLALSALVRITTSPRAYTVPSPIAEAFEFCRILTGQPNCRVVEPGERHWAIFERLCRETETTGPRVTDAWFAALAIEHGCEWITFDRDYARYPGLKWRVPGK